MKYKIIIIVILSLLLFQFCEHNPVNSRPGTAIQFIFQIPANSENQPHLGKALSPQEIDKIKVVFYALDVSYEEYYENYYELKYQDIYNFNNEFTGDPLDFDDYWVRKDKGEIDIITNGDYSVEKRSTLSIRDGNAYGEFELSQGLKTCRVGIFEDGVLTWVGKSGYMHLHTHHGEEDEPHYVYITLEQVDPTQRK
ncbi:MAG: hypothetical protein JXQ65_06830 [Candidatus Marinimicrobia bacterium]|nr:hypothetical protein [Candidatus Neomarinimicrobiota bacterium]